MTTALAEPIRDFAVTVLVLATAAFVWFGWGQENPPRSWRVAMIIGSVLSGVMMIVGALLTWRLWGSASVLDDQAARRAYGIVVGIEFASAFLGAGVLGITKRSRYIATWILLVVGVHFVPLAAIFREPGLLLLAVLTTLAAAASWVLYRRARLTPSTVTGLAGGGVLLAFAIRAATLAVFA